MCVLGVQSHLKWINDDLLEFIENSYFGGVLHCVMVVIGFVKAAWGLYVVREFIS